MPDSARDTAFVDENGLPVWNLDDLYPGVDSEQLGADFETAKAEAEPEIAPHHPQPGRSSAARPWGEVVARTFKLKG